MRTEIDEIEDLFSLAAARPPAPAPVEADPCQGRTIWNSDGTDGPCLITAPPAPLAVLPDPPKRARVATIVTELKEADQDHEFYPTTDAIIARLASDVGLRSGDDWRQDNWKSVLDIGAGNGKVLRALKERCKIYDLYAIEKSQRLCQELDAEILIVGTNFHEQSLFSKHVDLIFCNPPFSEFEDWTTKIIRQAAAQVVYMVLPERWNSNAQIAEALAFRSVSARSIGDFDFLDAERAARCKVQLVKIDYRHEDKESGRYYQREPDLAFEKFFKAQFADLIKKFKQVQPEKDEETDKPKKDYHALVIGPNYPGAMVNIYNEELAHIERNYALIAELDADLLREFDVNPDRIMACLKARLSGLRSEYWNELFAHLTSITNRLTSESRQKILETLGKHVQVDFTLDNILAVIVWLLKNANKYIDSQLIETYEKLVDKCNVILYKSNKRTWTDEKWRYCHRDETDKPSHYALDYRIVTHRAGGISHDYSGNSGLDERAATFIKDIMTIARNLGFECDTGDNRLHAYRHGTAKGWESNSKEEFHYAGGLLFDVRAFQNGNLHFRLNQKFILALNVEHGRLKGWLRTGHEASEELQNPKAAALFKSNLQLPLSDPGLMLTGGEA